MNGQEKKMNRETIFLFERTRGHTNADIDTGKAGGERSTKKKKRWEKVMSCAMQIRHAGVVHHQLVCRCDGSSLIVMQDILNDGGGAPVPVPAADDILELDTEPGPKNPSSRIPVRRPNPAPAPAVAPTPVRLLPLLGRPRGVYGCTCPKPYPSGALSLRARDSFLS